MHTGQAIITPNPVFKIWLPLDMAWSVVEALSAWNEALEGTGLTLEHEIASTPPNPDVDDWIIWQKPLVGRLGEADLTTNPQAPWQIIAAEVRLTTSYAWDATSSRHIALHELAHVLGFGHPDEAGESVRSVANSGHGIPSFALTDYDKAQVRAVYPGWISMMQAAQARIDARSTRKRKTRGRLKALRHKLSRSKTFKASGRIRRQIQKLTQRLKSL